MEQKKRKAPPHAWKKGQSGNLSGRPKVPQEIKDLIKKSRHTIYADIAEIRDMTRDELKDLVAHGTGGRAAIAHAYLKFNHQGIKIYEDRLIGKAVESVELSGKDGEPLQVDYHQQILDVINGSGKAADTGNTQ